ncbi:MAG: FAD binding domain-containing protein [Firmicutes bacterium]|nr:FAD binding domain-containing protein [Bacillota bacterium]
MRINNYHKAVSLEDAYEVLKKNGQNSIIAGGAWMRLSSKEIETAIDLSNLGLDQIVLADNSIKIGAMATLRDVESSDLVQALGDGILCQAIHKIMGVSIRNLATIGGSVIGKFGFSDIMTPLLVLETTLEFYKKGKISLEDFLESKDREPDILLHIYLKKQDTSGYFYKMTKNSLDFAVVNVAISKTNNQFKIAVGARPSIAHLAQNAMNYLNGEKVINDEVISKAVEIAMQEFKFGTNSRSSEEYRSQIAAVYINRGLNEVNKR